MTYASDQLYKGYLRRNMAHFVTIVKVMDILPHLHCLTDSDRDEIVAKRESTGNYNAMQLLLDCLRRREDWPSIFIRALEETEQRNLASELRREYESLLVQHNGPPPPQQPPVTAVANNPPPPYPSPPEYSGPEASPATNQVPAALPAEAASHENTPPKDIAAASVPPPNLAPAPQPDRPSAPSQSLPPQPHSSGAEAHTSLPANLSQALTQHSLLDQSEAKSPVQETDSPDGKVVSTPVKPAEVSQAGINKQHTSPPQESPTQQTSRTSRGTAALDHHNAFPIPSSSGGHSNAKDEFPTDWTTNWWRHHSEARGPSLERTREQKSPSVGSANRTSRPCKHRVIL
ncbi:mitochondrial antiviral-signaling protein isoform X2 [Amia ocellicauda]|uniref:mitochondrial antiviral-signaling protein isoform X2 n=1 Tax=Amia ocellicauda TaxID=2972642 RepID=UPI0034642C47